MSIIMIIIIINDSCLLIKHRYIDKENHYCNYIYFERDVKYDYNTIMVLMFNDFYNDDNDNDYDNNLP